MRHFSNVHACTEACLEGYSPPPPSPKYFLSEFRKKGMLVPTC